MARPPLVNRRSPFIAPSAPDVVLPDLFLPDGYGFDVGLRLRQQLPRVNLIVPSEQVRPKVLMGLPDSERPHWSYLLKTGVASCEALTADKGSNARVRAALLF